MSAEPSKRLSQEQVQAIFDRSPFISFLGLRVVGLDHEQGEITVSMPLRPELERRSGTGQFHGGPLASFIDTVGDFAVGMEVGGGVPTINMRIDYLRPAIGASVTGVARVRRLGKSTAVVDVDVFDASNKLVAVGRCTYAPQTG
jgi:uncharacterized protein (TIGR00369 family)